MDYIKSLIRQAGPAPISPLGDKPNSAEEVKLRQLEASRLTKLLEENKTFSFIRMGDMDLWLLLAHQDCILVQVSDYSSSSTGTLPQGDPGISSLHSTRLWNAFCNANYVDFYDRIWPSTKLIHKLHLPRDKNLYSNLSPDTSLVIYPWVEYEFKSYCEKHRVGFVGAEACILEFLYKNPIFIREAGNFWPESGEQFFLQPRDNGSNLDDNLDFIKQDLITFVKDNNIDTLFISLGGAAKILCYELAKELSIRCIDFGAMLRGLCYLGSDGNRIGRSTHSPFLYRLPFNLVMDAVEYCFPSLKPEQLISKAHSQLILEMQRKVVAWTCGAHEFDFSLDNQLSFRNSLREYQKRYSNLTISSNAAYNERRNFILFCGKHRFTVKGILTWNLFQIKSFFSKYLKALLHLK